MSEMNVSSEIGKLVEALALAQLDFKPVVKDTANPYFSSKYADLASVIGATQPALAKNGLVVIQSPLFDLAEEKAGVTTILAHSSGQWISNDLLLPATMKGKDGVPRFDAQSVGSALTYARRYSYQAIVGVAAELDDDGNSASGKDGSKEAAQSVGDRKVAEYRAKKATTADSSPSAGKQAPTPADEEPVVLTPYKDGLMALSGRNLSIVRSGMTKDDLDFFKVTRVDDRWTIQASLAFKFQDLCTRCKVGSQIMNAQTDARGPMAPEKAAFPPFASPGKSDSTDPILIDAKRSEPKPGKKPCLYVKWMGRDHSSFDKGIWPILEAAKGKPVMLETKENGKYSNIVRILRVDGVSFDDE